MEWGQAIGAAIGATASHIEGALGRRHSSKEAKKAAIRSYNLWRSQLLNGPSLERQGLENAGYNPMLAINGGLGSFNIPSVPSGGSSGIPDIVGSAKAGSELVNDFMQAFKDDHKQKEAQTELLQTDAQTRKAAAQNDFLKTLSQLENDAVERDLKKSQTTKTKVDTIAEPLSDVGKMGIGAGATVGGSALMKFAKKYFPKIAPTLSGSAAQIGSKALAGAGFALPLLLGSAGYAGWQAQKSKTGRKLAEDEKAQHGNWSR